MRLSMRLVAFITVLLAGETAFCSSPDACSLTSTVTDAKVTLSIPDGRTSILEGEIIPLVLSFMSTVDKQYRVADRNFRVGALDTDTYCLEPEARDPLADSISTLFSMVVGNQGGEQQLSEKPSTVTVELNERRQPGPGHYRLWVVTNRVSGEPREPMTLDSSRRGGRVR